jgi:hypothetical protein
MLNGTWIPIISNLLNLASVTVKIAKYTKINNEIFITLQVDDIPAINVGNTGFEFSLPFNVIDLNDSSGGVGIGMGTGIFTGINESAVFVRLLNKNTAHVQWWINSSINGNMFITCKITTN